MKTILLTVLIVFIVFYFLTVILSTLYFKFNLLKFFYHDIMGWHLPTKCKHFDGLSMTSVCRNCGKHILQDSQGNWFI